MSEKLITFKDVKNNPEVKLYIERSDVSLSKQGFTEHSYGHVGNVAAVTEYILIKHGSSERDIQLAKIAAYLHDIGNLINRENHSQSGAIIAFRLLEKMGMDPAEIITIVTAIGNHDEGNGLPVSDIAAALIIADKCDVRRSRVRNNDITSFDIHDRVNYSVQNADINIITEENLISLNLTLDKDYSSIMDYFEIFLGRMVLCKKAASSLGMIFRLQINGQRVV